MANTIKPSDVFVPGRFPIEDENVYADRGTTQKNLVKCLDRGFVPIVFGSYGVGKSSLSRFCGKPWEQRKKLVYIESVYGKNLANIFERVLEFVGYEVTVESHSVSEKTASNEMGFNISGGILGYLKAKIAGKIGRKRKKQLGHKRELLIKSPSDGKILDLCEEKQIFLLIDEIHRASDRLRIELSAFLKAYANRNPKLFKIGLVGTEIDASKLIIRDPGIDRLLQEIQVKPILPAEAESIIYPGMEKLGITVPKEVGDRVVKASVGSPFIVQYLCLEMAEEAKRGNISELSTGLYGNALRTYAERKAQRAIRQYRRAIETVGSKRYRKQILHAMAKCDDDYVTMDQIANLVSSQLGEETPSTALSGPLRVLKSEQYDQILTDIEGSKEGERIYNYSAFSDPAMKSIIRMVLELEKEESSQIFSIIENL